MHELFEACLARGYRLCRALDLEIEQAYLKLTSNAFLRSQFVRRSLTPVEHSIVGSRQEFVVAAWIDHDAGQYLKVGEHTFGVSPHSRRWSFEWMAVLERISAGRLLRRRLQLRAHGLEHCVRSAGDVDKYTSLRVSHNGDSLHRGQLVLNDGEFTCT